MRHTSEMCMISVPDPNREDGVRHIDLGNYAETDDGRKCLITSREKARRYQVHIKVPIYVPSNGGRIT